MFWFAQRKKKGATHLIAKLSNPNQMKLAEADSI
jgi:hypothetical protein